MNDINFDLCVYDFSGVSLRALNERLRETTKKINDLKNLKHFAEIAIEDKLFDAARKSLIDDGKEMGTTRFMAEGCVVTATIPKKIVWDQEKLEELLKKVPKEKRKEYVQTSYKIDERNYKTWTREIKTFFNGARTLIEGKPKFKIKDKTND